MFGYTEKKNSGHTASLIAVLINQPITQASQQHDANYS